MNNINWDYLRFFLAVAEQGSVSAASRTLSQSQATVWRKVYALEQDLGVKLFDTSRTGYSLTASGLALLPIAKALADEAEKVRNIASSNPVLNGVVRMVAPDIFVDFLSRELVYPFRESQPGILFDLFTASPAMSLAERDCDLALLVSKSLHPNLTAISKVNIAFDLYASQPFLDDLKKPTTEQNISGLPLVDFDQQGAHLVPIGWQKLAAKMPRVLCSNSPAMRISATKAGLGVSLLPKFVAAQHPALVSVTDSYEFGVLKMELCLNKHRENVPTVAASIQHLVKKLRLLGQ